MLEAHWADVGIGTPSRGNSKFKGPGVGTSRKCLRTRKKTVVAAHGE